MGIFDELGKKVATMGQNVAVEAKKISETARVNGEIDKERNKLNTQYVELGKSCFETYKDVDGEFPYKAIVETIKATMARLDILKNELQGIRGTKSCSQCGSEMPAQAAFCSSCGWRAPVAPVVPVTPAATAATAAPEVTAESTAPEVTAKSAATEVTAESAAPAEPVTCAQPAQTAEPANPVAQVGTEGQAEGKRICPNCNVEGDDGAAFCHECGSKIA